MLVGLLIFQISLFIVVIAWYRGTSSSKSSIIRVLDGIINSKDNIIRVKDDIIRVKTADSFEKNSELDSLSIELNGAVDELMVCKLQVTHRNQIIKRLESRLELAYDEKVESVLSENDDEEEEGAESEAEGRERAIYYDNKTDWKRRQSSEKNLSKRGDSDLNKHDCEIEIIKMMLKTSDKGNK